MCRLIESIRIDHQGIRNLEWHQRRLNHSRESVFQNSTQIELVDYLHKPALRPGQLVKCRIVYSEEIIKIEYLTYEKKDIATLKIVTDNEISYQFKYENRNNLNKLLELRAHCDDVLIVKNNQVTDTSYCNIIFFDGENWITPKNPLLAGTMRAYLLQQKAIIAKDIHLEAIKKFKKFKLINAMFGFESSAHPIENIIF